MIREIFPETLANEAAFNGLVSSSVSLQASASMTPIFQDNLFGICLSFGLNCRSREVSEYLLMQFLSKIHIHPMVSVLRLEMCMTDISINKH